MKTLNKGIITTALGACLSLSANATTIQVQVSSLFDDGGLAMTPVWLGFHDGMYDAFDAGSVASSSLQSLAENGMTAGIEADFAMSNPMGVQSVLAAPTGAAPVFEPGETATSGLLEIEAMSSGYFSFLSMLIPTNDAFIGNDNPMAYSLFNDDGNFVGLDILVLGSSVYDSGTELNRGFGAPFLQGAEAEARQNENGVVTFHNGLEVLPGGLAIIGGTTATGYTLDQAAADFTASGFEVARITVSQVPEPATLGFFAIGLLGLMARIKRKLAD
ncbi:spondin domain-containing protein [Aliiglaciecola sp. 3_MG-2023]|uniref:spondin domain-containing protein n=1 Tax=Aliiglaciecola TaxID=1406885 RepID=UPI001C083731|nr:MULTISPECIES: spondin domain-containing protein [Aliiglaciecola]MBU2878585.1 spondin domain-containing protein [Aliiglaciecola lipolytica]MDO6692110.1 spondin domain-containing protein [Aliiglaciecola sp. 3_MG-2023]MDO6709586.1 spondin domain-containing protein [Aliiglaciecola sp. 2_MG-2023]MDO6750872.1 spondin domain-containing protein [Aliiglaciecola sp. 1_MG-2023]